MPSLPFFNRRLPSFVSVCYCLLSFVLTWSRILVVGSISVGFFHIVSFAYVRFGFLECRGVCIRFALCCCCLYTLCSVCYCLFVSLRFCAGLHRLLLGSEATVVFVGVSCGEPGGNTDCGCDCVFIGFLQWMLFLCFIGVRLETPASTAVFQSPFTIICLGMLSFAFACFDMVAYSFLFAGVLFFLFMIACLHLLTFALVFLSTGAFAFVLLSVVVVCAVLFCLLSFVCFLALLRWFASFVTWQLGHSRICGCFMW